MVYLKGYPVMDREIKCSAKLLSFAPETSPIAAPKKFQGEMPGYSEVTDGAAPHSYFPSLKIQVYHGVGCAVAKRKC